MNKEIPKIGLIQIVDNDVYVTTKIREPFSSNIYEIKLNNVSYTIPEIIERNIFNNKSHLFNVIKDYFDFRYTKEYKEIYNTIKLKYPEYFI